MRSKALPRGQRLLPEPADPGGRSETGQVDEILAGGVANAGSVRRHGELVLRPSTPYSDAVHAFLRALPFLIVSHVPWSDQTLGTQTGRVVKTLLLMQTRAIERCLWTSARVCVDQKEV